MNSKRAKNRSKEEAGRPQLSMAILDENWMTISPPIYWRRWQGAEEGKFLSAALPKLGFGNKHTSYGTHSTHSPVQTSIQSTLSIEVFGILLCRYGHGKAKQASEDPPGESQRLFRFDHSSTTNRRFLVGY